MGILVYLLKIVNIKSLDSFFIIFKLLILMSYNIENMSIFLFSLFPNISITLCLLIKTEIVSYGY